MIDIPGHHRDTDHCIHTQRCTTTLLASPACSIVTSSSSIGFTVGCAVFSVYGRPAFPLLQPRKRAYGQLLHPIHEEVGQTYASTKPRMSRTRWCRFIRAVRREPSARRTWTRVVGRVPSTSNCVPLPGARGSAVPCGAALALGGNPPGIADDGAGPAEEAGTAEGTGEPRRWPAPANARCDAAPAGATYGSCVRFEMRSSTGWPGRIERIAGGARLWVRSQVSISVYREGSGRRKRTLR